MSNVEKSILNFLFYLVPVFIIMGSAAINIFLFVVNLYFFYFIFNNRNIEIISLKKYYLFYFFLFYLVINLFLAKDFNLSLERNLTYFRFIIFVFAFKYFIENGFINLKKASLIWVIILSFLSFDLFFESIFGFNIVGHSNRSYGFGNIRNSSFFFDELKAASIFVAIGIPSLILYFNNNKNIKFLIILQIFMFATLITGERANFIRFCIILFGYIVFFRKDFLTLINLKALLASLFLIVSILPFFGPEIYNRYFSTYTMSKSKDYESNFFKAYLSSHYGAHAINSYYIVKDNIFLGVGNKNFRKSCVKHIKKVNQFQKKNFKDYPDYITGCNIHPHQIYYELLTEPGILGTFILMLMLIIFIFKRVKKIKMELINIVGLLFLLCSFLPFLPSGSFFSTNNAFLFWINVLFFMLNLKKISKVE